MPLSILYLGADSPGSTSRHRADALRRIGHHVLVIDPDNLLPPPGRLRAFLHYRSGFRFLQWRLLASLRRSLSTNNVKHDLIWVDSGEKLGPQALRWLKKRYNCPCILFNVDDPTGSRDYHRFITLRAALSVYSLAVFVRQETALEALALGAQNVLIVHRSYDESIHSIQAVSAEAISPSIISFVGTYIPGEHRDRFLARLFSLGLPIAIHGNRWIRSPDKNLLHNCYKGPALSGCTYARQLSTASVTLGLLSHGNRDLITQRSLETSACGGLLCAERTSEHQLLYEDGQEAVFWDSPQECILKCHNLLRDPNLNITIRSAGHQHVHRLAVGNEDICRHILRAI